MSVVQFPEWLEPMKATRGHWVTPEVVVQVSFLEWTGEGHDAKLRQSRLIGIRTDKPPREVVRERP